MATETDAIAGCVCTAKRRIAMSSLFTRCRSTVGRPNVRLGQRSGPKSLFRRVEDEPFCLPRSSFHRNWKLQRWRVGSALAVCLFLFSRSLRAYQRTTAIHHLEIERCKQPRFNKQSNKSIATVRCKAQRRCHSKLCWFSSVIS